MLSDWLTHQHRDTCASIVGHSTLTSFLALADNEATGRIKFEMTEVSPNDQCFHFCSQLLMTQRSSL